MKNKMIDLKNHLFAALERLNNEELTEDQVKTEITRAQAVAEIGKVIVDGAKTSLMFAKITGKAHELKEDEFMDDPKLISRPPAEYSNNGHQKTLEKYS